MHILPIIILHQSVLYSFVADKLGDTNYSTPTIDNCSSFLPSLFLTFHSLDVIGRDISFLKSLCCCQPCFGTFISQIRIELKARLSG